MGTRGSYGFRKNGMDKLTYNHYDSYPDYLGGKVIEFIEGSTIQELNDIYERLILVDEMSTPTPEQIKECNKYLDTGVSSGQPTDWYCLLRKAQGELDAYKNGLRYMINNNDFIKDSLFCEYAYIINLDTNQLEFWTGFQKRPQEDNRYGTEKDGEYYPCKCLQVWDLAELIMNKLATGTSASEDIAATMNGLAEQDYSEQEKEVS